MTEETKPEIGTVETDDPPHCATALVECRMESDRMECLIRVTVYSPGNFRTATTDGPGGTLAAMVDYIGIAVFGFLSRRKATGNGTEEAS